MQGKIYTRAGDKGKTRLLSGQLVSKEELRVEAYGTADELTCALGLARALLSESESKLAGPIRMVQTESMTLGSLLASDDPGQWERLPHLSGGAVARLESEIDEMTEALSPLDSFVVPGGTRASAQLQVCRTVCRRAERRAVALALDEPVAPGLLEYLNRLSDWLFTAARYANHLAGLSDDGWLPSKPDGSRS